MLKSEPSLIATRYGLAIALSVFLFAGASHGAPAEERAPAGPKASTASFQRLVDRYCVTCHNKELNTGSFRLDNVDLAQVAANGAIWEKVIQKLSVGEMPPPDQPQLSKGAHNAFLSHLVTTLDGVATASPNPGRPGAHRLNRTEYTNAIRDLLALEIDGSMFLSSDSPDFGFDNIADSLKLTPMMLGRYISAAARISKLAIGDINTRPSNQIYSTSKELMQYDRMGEDFSFGSRGGMSVSHHFPLDGEYILKARVEIPNPALSPDYFQRSEANEQLYLRLDGEQVEKFQVGLPWKFPKGPSKKKRYVSDDSVSPEEYAARERAGAFEARVAVKAGTHTITAEFLERTLVYEGLRPEHYPSYYNFDFDILQHEEPGVLTIHITGPYNVTGLGDESQSRQKIFTRYPSAPEEETEVATEILSTLARRAYRRPITAGDMDTLLTFYNQGREKGDFEFGIRTALEYILVDPEFLFRVETQPEGLATGDAFELSDLDLASRLSFFLWSTIPDEELLSIAERGELRNPGNLEEQVQRMLADDRSVSLVDNFATQWLYLRNMEVVAPDPKVFPEFDGDLRAAMRRETELLFASQLKEDRSVPELLSARYTYLNQRLAEHYGIPGVHGSHFRRVELNDPNRGGLMGQASIWTVTSYSTRTSPVKRGKWILENLLGMPPPPPPGDIPPLQEPSKDTVGMTLRQLFEEHRKAPECASCHVKMDPLGFALENFDAIGKWRTHNAFGLPLDTRGSMPDGTFLEGPAGLRDVLKSMEDDFTQTAVQKLLVYALGRGLEYYDQPVVRQIMRDSKSNDYRWSSIILGIVNSTPFQMRRAN